MTTIAYKDGIVAFDSYITAGDLITDFNKNKCQTHKGVKFIFSGRVDHEPLVINAWFGDDSEQDCEACAVVLHDGKVYHCAFDNECVFYKSEIKENCSAFGSGSPFAIGAMDNGASASEAVKIACNRDVFSGGKVRTIKL